MLKLTLKNAGGSLSITDEEGTRLYKTYEAITDDKELVIKVYAVSEELVEDLDIHLELEE